MRRPTSSDFSSFAREYISGSSGIWKSCKRKLSDQIVETTSRIITIKQAIPIRSIHSFLAGQFIPHFACIDCGGWFEHQYVSFLLCHRFVLGPFGTTVNSPSFNWMSLSRNWMTMLPWITRKNSSSSSWLCRTNSPLILAILTTWPFSSARIFGLQCSSNKENFWAILMVSIFFLLLNYLDCFSQIGIPPESTIDGITQRLASPPAVSPPSTTKH